MAHPFVLISFLSRIVGLVKQMDWKLKRPEKSRLNTQVRSENGKVWIKSRGSFEVKKYQAVSCFQKDFPMIFGYFGMGKISVPPYQLILHPSEDHHCRRSSFVSETSGAGQWVFWFGGAARLGWGIERHWGVKTCWKWSLIPEDLHFKSTVDLDHIKLIKLSFNHIQSNDP